MTDISVDWVDEVPERLRTSPYDEIAERVRESSKVAKITTSKGSLHTLANRLRHRYPDLGIKGRTTSDGHFVFVFTLTPAEALAAEIVAEKRSVKRAAAKAAKKAAATKKKAAEAAKEKEGK